MKVGIMVFSPSGHTLKAANMIAKACEKKGSKVTLIDATKKDKLLFDENGEKNLREQLGEYDLLFVGAPIYAGHMEENMLHLIKNLPTPDEEHGNLAVPFVTYGGAHSSVALEEAGRHLKGKGYISILGIKIVAMHTLSYEFSKHGLDNLPGEDEENLINEAVDKIFKLMKEQKSDIKDSYKAFRYAPFMQRVMFKKFTQKKIHDKFKTVKILRENCIGCGRCIASCPVNNFKVVDKKVEKLDEANRCILCGECYNKCPVQAIYFEYIDMAKKRLKNGNYTLEKKLNQIYTLN